MHGKKIKLLEKDVGKKRSTTAILLVFLMSISLTVPQNTFGQQETKESRASVGLSPSEQKLFRSPSGLSPNSSAFWGRVASSLEQPFAEQVEKGRGEQDVALYKKAAPATVLIETDKGSGSGSTINDKGDILTAAHVIDGASNIVVFFKPDTKASETEPRVGYGAIPVKVDKTSDLALLRLRTTPPHLDILPLGNPEDLEVGQDIHAIGHPGGGHKWTYTSGVLSQIRPDYQWPDEHKGPHRATVVQTQTPLNPGNSGGPLLNDSGELIGVNSFILIFRDGLNYAVSVESVRAFLQSSANEVKDPSMNSKTTLSKIERYGDIIGGYNEPTDPPPDMWLITNAANGPAYVVRGSNDRLLMNLVLVATNSSEGNGNSILYHIDANCDGMVDVLGLDENTDGVIDRYGRPEQQYSLVTLTPEFATALARHTIPYSNLKLCSGENSR